MVPAGLATTRNTRVHDVVRREEEGLDRLWWVISYSAVAGVGEKEAADPFGGTAART